MSDHYANSAQPGAPNSTMAVISLVSGILGLTLLPFLGSIAALIIGYLAKQEIRESAGMMGGDGLATAGIVMGWIGVGLGVIGCCIGAAVFLVPACLIPLGLGFEQFGSIISSVIAFI